MYGTGHLVERNAFTQSTGEISLGRLDPIGVIGMRAVPAALARRAVARERGCQHIGNELKRNDIDPERIDIGRFQPQHELAVPPECTGIAGAGDEGKRFFRAIVDGGIQFADHVVEHARREGENSATIAAVGRMADAIGRILGEEYRLVDVGGHAQPPDVLAERAMAQEDDAVGAGMLFGGGAATAGTTTVVAHADDAAFVQRVEGERIFGATWHTNLTPTPSHGRRRTSRAASSCQ